jgi:hypothetical protein
MLTVLGFLALTAVVIRPGTASTGRYEQERGQWLQAASANEDSEPVATSAV